MRRRIRPASATSPAAIARRYGQDPVRTATLAYDAVALVAALAKTQGQQRFSPDVLTNPSGFTGIDGLFRFRPDGTNQRGLAVMRVAAGGGVAGRGLAEELWRVTELKPARSAPRRRAPGKPASVTRSMPSASSRPRPARASIAMRRGSSGRPASARVARGVDAFGEPQAHQQEFVGASPRA